MSPNAPLQEVLLPEESGPRHLIWRSDGQYAYVANELANTVVVLQEENHRLQPVQVVSTLPPDFQGESTCAAIKFSPDERFLYVSNRGHERHLLLSAGRVRPAAACGDCSVLGKDAQGPCVG